VTIKCYRVREFTCTGLEREKNRPLENVRKPKINSRYYLGRRIDSVLGSCFANKVLFEWKVYNSIAAILKICRQVVKTGKNHLNDKITPLLSTGKEI
jgi:hypothetical protein